MMLILTCPHCKDEIIVMREEINCGIFRHGVHKGTYEQLNPHATQEECDTSDIYGCGKPFRIVDDKAIICDYI